ncbi:MAG: GNAT family protein [Candidatus Sericytochromatia bacterium]
MIINYRTLSISDFEQYSLLRELALDTYPESFASTNIEEKDKRQDGFNSIIHSEFNFFMGVFDNANLIGSVLFSREIKNKMKHKGNIFAMFLKTEYQGKGIANKLLKETLNKAFNIDGINQINLAVNASNSSAIKLYEKNGFKTYGFEKNSLFINNKYFDDLLMVLFRENYQNKEISKKEI